MGRVLTNNISIQYSIEASLGELAGSPVWKLLEPNSFGSIGSTISTVARDPISKNRQRRKGTVTDLDSTADFEADLTLSHWEDFAEGFVFSEFVGASEFDPVSADASSYTVDSISITLTAGTLIFARAFGEVENNGLKEVDTGATATSIPVVETLVAEASAPDNASVEVAGFRTAAGDLAVTDVTGNQVTITSVSDVFAEPGLDIHPGCALFFGGSASINKFSTAANVGYVRVVSIAGDGSQIVVDKTQQTWVEEAAGTQEVDFYVGKFLRNVATDDDDFLERSFQFETTYPNLNNSPAGDMYEYSKGNYCNTMGVSLPLTDKATMSFAFVGTDTPPPTATRASGAASGILPSRTASFNTTQDIARLRVTEVDETGLTTDFKSVTLNLNNNVSPEKVLGTLGAKFMNYGNFEVSIEAQALFTEAAVVSAIRNNTTLSMDFSIKNDDGAIFVDIPAMTLGGGGKDFPVNETVLINMTGEAFADSALNTSIGITNFAYIPGA